MRIVRWIFTLWAVAGIVTGGMAAERKVGFDRERIGRADRVVEKAIAAGEIPGAVAWVSRDGKVAYHRAFGYSDIEAKTPMQKDSIFRIASMTKAVTSVGVMILYEQGRFKLTDPVSKYLPEFKNPRVLVSVKGEDDFETRPAKREITIRDLLTHTSGITYPFAGSELQKAYKKAGIIDGLTAEPLVLRDVMGRLAKMPLLHDPGERWTYGLNTDVLGYLIEQVSGKPLYSFFRSEIFEPLGMNDTGFYLPKVKQNRLVTLYGQVPGGPLARVSVMEEFQADAMYPVRGATYYSGGAGLCATARDYGQFVLMLLNDGVLEGRRVLSRKSVELMRTSHFDAFGGAATDFGLGFSITQNVGAAGELGSVGSYAWGGAFYTSFWIDPKERLVAVFMSQVRPANTDVGEQFRLAVYQAME